MCEYLFVYVLIHLKLDSHLPKILFKTYNKINIFFKNHAGNEGGRLVPDYFLLFEKALFEVKASYLQLCFNIFQLPSTWDGTKGNCIKLYTIDPDICSVLIF